MAALLAGVASLALVVLGLSFGASSASADSTALIQDSFTTNSVSSPEYLIGGTGGSPANTACLTVPGATAGSVPASCTGATDASGSGALQLNPATGNETGYLLFNHTLPTSAGISISFNMYQYGGTGADGIGFFLTNGADALTGVGASGGSLGYQNSVAGSGKGQAGLPNALLGVGFDSYGNFVHETNNTAAVDGGTCPIEDATWTAKTPNAVAVRGPGVLTSGGVWGDGYCLLGQGVQPAGGIHSTATVGNRSDAVRAVTIVVDPPSDSAPKVTVSMGPMGVLTNPVMTQVTQVPEPSILATTPTFKFGWSSSTGGSNDIHEISNLAVGTVIALPAVLSDSATSPAAAVIGATSAATFHSTTSSADGPVASGTPITMTVNLASGLDWGALPASSAGWAFESTTETQAVYTYTPAATILPGDPLPDLALPVVGMATGGHDVTAVISGGGMTAASGPAQSAISVVNVLPSASGVTYTTEPASPAPTAEAIATPPTSATTSPVYAIVTPPSVGAATIDPSTGVITYTPAPNTSDQTTLTYDVTDNGQTSAPATVSITTPPATTPKTQTVNLGTTATVDLSSGAEGTATLHYQLVSAPPASAGTASVSGTDLTFVPVAGFSGTTTMTYQAVDPNGVLSAPTVVTIRVNPQANSQTLTISLPADGTDNHTFTLPTPTGTGPFTYQLVPGSTPAGDGSFSIDPGTGTVTFAPAPGVSGNVPAKYTVTDPSGNVSPQQNITLTVLPYVANVSTSADAGNLSYPFPVPASEGTGPLVYSLTTGPPSSLGTATIDQASGVITYVPVNPDASGPVRATYTVTDASNGTSNVATANLLIRPRVSDVSGSGKSRTVSPDAIALDPTPKGTGPLSYAVIGSTPHFTVRSTATGFSARPDPGYVGTATFQFVVTDASGTVSETQTATVTATPGPNGLAYTGVDGVGTTIGAGLIALVAGVALLGIALRRRRPGSLNEQQNQ